MGNKKRLGVFIRELRERSNLTQVDLSRELGYSTSQFVSNWETGRSSPPLDAVARMIDIFKCPQRMFIDIMVDETRSYIEHQLQSKRKRGRAAR